jgi:hypothetical protein
MSIKSKVTTIKEAIDGFLLSCKVGGQSYDTIECLARYGKIIEDIYYIRRSNNG